MITCIRDGLIYDGTLEAPRRGDVWVDGERILAVGAAPDGVLAEQVVEAELLGIVTLIHLL